LRVRAGWGRGEREQVKIPNRAVKVPHPRIIIPAQGGNVWFGHGAM
jgi:hypothetical protein